MKEGNNRDFNTCGSIGLIASRLSVEGPIKKDKASFIVSGRYSYAGITANGLGLFAQALRITPFMDFTPTNEISFYDFNAKVNYKMKNDHFYLSAYSGHDHFYYYSIDDNASMNWGNLTGTVRWNHIFNSKLFSNTTIVFSNYNYSYILKDDARYFNWSASMQELDFKSDFDLFPNPSNHFKFGILLEKHRYFPGKIEPRDSSSLTKPFELDDQKSIESALYISNIQKINDRLSLSYGIRYSMFFLLGESMIYYYTSRNGYKLPPYHRLDISFTYKNPKRQTKPWKPEWNFGIYNIYDHKNIFSLFIKMVDNNFETSQAYKIYIYGITPYLSYNFRF